MKILITGGNGFIAKSLFEALGKEHDILSCNRQTLDLLEEEKVFDFLKKGKFDVVIHAATYDAVPIFSTKDPLRVLENNLRMFFNLVRCQDYFSKMIYFGTGAEFSREHWIPKMKETYFDQHVPSDQYSFSKYIMTKYTEFNDKIYNLRLFGVFGKYDDWRYRFIPNICCKAILDLPITINENKFFDYLYIDDLIKIVKWFLVNKPKHNIYNVCTGTTCELKAIAKKVTEISGKKLDIIIKDQDCSKEYGGDNSLLLRELGGFKFCSIDKAIENLYSWYDLNRGIIKKEELT